jgi:hypothetical protein
MHRRACLGRFTLHYGQRASNSSGNCRNDARTGQAGCRSGRLHSIRVRSRGSVRPWASGWERSGPGGCQAGVGRAISAGVPRWQRLRGQDRSAGASWRTKGTAEGDLGIPAHNQAPAPAFPSERLSRWVDAAARCRGRPLYICAAAGRGGGTHAVPSQGLVHRSSAARMADFTAWPISGQLPRNRLFRLP